MEGGTQGEPRRIGRLISGADQNERKARTNASGRHRKGRRRGREGGELCALATNRDTIIEHIGGRVTRAVQWVVTPAGSVSVHGHHGRTPSASRNNKCGGGGGVARHLRRKKEIVSDRPPDRASGRAREREKDREIDAAADACDYNNDEDDGDVGGGGNYHGGRRGR